MRQSLAAGLSAALMLSASGCDHEDSATGAESSSEERLRQARADMALGSGDEDAFLELTPDEQVPGWPREIDPSDWSDALDRVRESLVQTRPEPSASLDRNRFQTWIDSEYTPWVTSRGASIRDAVRALEELQEESAQRVIVHGLTGLMLLRFGSALATVPLPEVIRDDSDDSILYRQAFLTTSESLFDRAADAFGACAAESSRSADRELERWRSYCDEHLENAQLAPRPLR